MQTIHVAGLGVRVPVHLGGARVDELGQAMRRAWSRALCDPGALPEAAAVALELTASGEGGPGFSPRRDDRLLTSDDLATLLTQATQRITLSVIEAGTGELLMFHAGAVCHPQTGHSLVFVAQGGTGKTTLSRTLGAHGYGYLTDETVGITGDLRILPYPKPLSTRSELTREFKHEYSPDELGLGRHHPEPRVVGLVLLSRDDSTAEPRREPLGLLDAIVAVTPESSALAALERGLHSCADLIGAVGGVERWTYAEASSLVPWVEALLGAPDGPGLPAAPPRVRESARPAAPPCPPPAGEGDQWVRAGVADVLLEDWDGLVLLPGTLSRLSPVGVELWRQTACPRTLAELAAGMEARFGAPEDQDVTQATRAALVDLVNQGVLRQVADAAPA